MHAVLLLATLAALLSGPLLYAAAQRRPAFLAFLDGFVLVSIAGLVLIDVLPAAFGDGGAWCLAFLLLGLLGPTALEHGLTRARREAHLLALGLAILGLVLHSVGDGAALSGAAPDDHRQSALALAVAIHSIPVGLVVWWLLFPVFGAALPGFALLAMGAATVAGYVYGVSLSSLLGVEAWAWFQALIAGSILHVIFGRPHLDADSGHHHAAPRFEGLGNLVALFALAWLAHAPAPEAPVAGFLDRLLALSLESAPALLLAYLIGGFISSEFPDRWLRWIGRGGPAMQALRGMAAGLPLPICSCGVLPLYRSLIQRGLPQAAALAFLIATPEIGLTALFVSLPLLGVEVTLLRIGAAALLAVTVAWTLARLVPVAAPSSTVAAGCSHCDTHGHAIRPATHRLRRALHSGLIDLVDDTAAWIVAGLALAAAASPFVHVLMGMQLPDAVQVLLFAVLGIPVYVCAAGATPLVAVLIAAGVSPGAGIAFLLTGPATNLSTFGVLRRLHGARLAVLFAVCTAVGAILLGFAVNALVPADLATRLPIAHAREGAVYQHLSLIVLLALYAASLLRRGGRALFADLYVARHAAAG